MLVDSIVDQNWLLEVVGERAFERSDKSETPIGIQFDVKDVDLKNIVRPSTLDPDRSCANVA